MSFHYTRAEDGIVTVTMDMQGQSANTMSPAWHALIRDTVARLEAEKGLRGVIFTSAKKTFFAGGDLKSLLAMDGADAAFAANLTLEKSYLRRLEKLPVPVVAAINGAALGGGLEICLACHRRILRDSPGAITGLPEVTLGLLPGAGGVVRLPRLIGHKPALELLLSGRALAPSEALALGVVDALCPEGEELTAAARKWILAQGDKPQQPWDRASVLDLGEAEMAETRAMIATARADVLAKTRGKQPAPLKIIEIVEAGLGLDFESALAFESRNFLSLLGLPETRAGISLNFFATNAVRSGKMRPPAPKAPVTRFVLQDANPAGARLAELAKQRGIEAGETGCDLVIDALPGGASALAAEGILLSTRFPLSAPPDGFDPARALGLHLFAGAPEVRLAEIVAPEGVAPEALARAYDFAQSLHLTPVVVSDKPGLFTSRVFGALISECLYLTEEGLPLSEVEAAAFEIGIVTSPFKSAEALGLPIPPGKVVAGSTRREQAGERLLIIQAIEALRCLNAGILKSEAEVDLASVFGLGFPAHLGGAIRYIRGLGFDAFTARAETLAARHGQRFALHPTELSLLRNEAQAAARNHTSSKNGIPMLMKGQAAVAI